MSNPVIDKNWSGYLKHRGSRENELEDIYEIDRIK